MIFITQSGMLFDSGSISYIIKLKDNAIELSCENGTSLQLHKSEDNIEAQQMFKQLVNAMRGNYKIISLNKDL